MTPIKKTISKPSKTLKFINGDSGINSESYDFIVSELDIENESLRDQLVEAMREALVPKPDRSWVDFDSEDGNGIYADLLWNKQRVLLFSL